jgi:hypothetical protein
MQYNTNGRYLVAIGPALSAFMPGGVGAGRVDEFAGVSEGAAQQQRDEFLTNDMLSPDGIIRLRPLMKHAVTLRYLQARLSRWQIAELFQIAPSELDGPTGCQGSRAGCTPVEALSP